MNYRAVREAASALEYGKIAVPWVNAGTAGIRPISHRARSPGARAANHGAGRDRGRSVPELDCRHGSAGEANHEIDLIGERSLNVTTVARWHHADSKAAAAQCTTVVEQAINALVKARRAGRVQRTG